MARLAFLGLGVMGGPMAGHLVKAGHEVTVWNRSAPKAEAWGAKHAGKVARSIAEAVEGADFVMACVGNDDDLREVCLGASGEGSGEGSGKGGAFAAMKKGAIFVDHTTVSARVTRELHAAAEERGLGFVDAPVSGGQVGAENGQLAIMCGGSAEDYAQVEPVIAAYARTARRLGESGAGQIAKMMNQICIAGTVQGLAEALAFGQKAGMDCEAVIEVIKDGAAGSWQMANRYKTMLADQFDFGFAVDWMRKDLAICLATGNEIGAALPVTALVDQFYKDVQNMGGGRNDTSSLIRRLK